MHFGCVELVEQHSSTRSTRSTSSTKSNVSSRVESSRDEPSGTGLSCNAYLNDFCVHIAELELHRLHRTLLARLVEARSDVVVVFRAHTLIVSAVLASRHLSRHQRHAHQRQQHPRSNHLHRSSDVENRPDFNSSQTRDFVATDSAYIGLAVALTVTTDAWPGRSPGAFGCRAAPVLLN